MCNFCALVCFYLAINLNTKDEFELFFSEHELHTFVVILAFKLPCAWNQKQPSRFSGLSGVFYNWCEFVHGVIAECATLRASRLIANAVTMLATVGRERKSAKPHTSFFLANSSDIDKWICMCKLSSMSTFSFVLFAVKNSVYVRNTSFW